MKYLIPIVIVAFLLIACTAQQAATPPTPSTDQQAQQPAPPAPEKTIKVGGLYCLTGDLVDLAHGDVNGVRMAVEDFQAETGTKVQLIEEDDKSCTDKVTGATKLIDVDEVQAILGTTCSSMTLAVAPIAEASKTLVISPISSAAAVSTAGDYTFRTYSSDATKSQKVADDIIKHGYKRVAYVYANDNDAITGGIKGVMDDLKGSDAQTVVDEPVGGQDVDFRTPLLKVKNAKPDVFVISFTTPKQFADLMKQYDQLKVPRVPVYTPIETIENDDVVKLGGQSVEGILYPYFAPPAGPRYDEWSVRYKAKYNESPPTYSAEGYDGAMIVLKAIAQSDGSREDAQKQMFVVGTNYPGVSGDITFDKNGDVTRPLIMKTIMNGTFVTLG